MKRILLAMVLTGALLQASHLSTLMARYKRAPENQRYRIMNQIKLEIARLNKKRQRSAIRQLRSVTDSVERKKTRQRSSNTHHTRKSNTSHQVAPSRTRDHSPMDVISGTGSSGPTGHAPGVSMPDISGITGGSSGPGGTGSSGGAGSSGGDSSSGGGIGPGSGMGPGGFF